MLMSDRAAQVEPVLSLDRANRARRAGSLPEPAGLLFSDEVVARLFRPFEHARGILLAVSGGPDSVALMLMAAQWADRLAAPPPISVATVDHGLRENARREAESVARWASELSLPHIILSWEGVKPKSRIQELAREARYELLFRHAASLGADYLMTAHHADDQAETILFRLLCGSGMCGLAGMQSFSERNGLILARPLLDYAKAELTAFCAAKAHPYVEDPSNADPAYARTNLRRLSGLLAREGLSHAALLKLGKRAARAEAALASRARTVRERLPARRQAGIFEADISALANEPDEIVLRILADELKWAGSGKALRLNRLEALAAKLTQALRAGLSCKATLGGTVLRLKSNRTLVIVKERARQRDQ